ncbi:alpha-ketoacid dehydrogenase subunit beta [Dactylosporangium sp. CA-139066]|uniref:alpha-ketoacid dehydrogenase subunit beta n=1 Tax=Dactylosporangium sp. CA-139066 TaxID=3239930 RepID=UPI003D91A42B
MPRARTVGEDLNGALHALLADDPRAYVLGEDIADPYGGAFNVTKGLTTRFPDRALTTPISESAIVGAAAGLALAGDVAVVEVMFGDFAALAFDQLVNFASKSVSMYGERLPMRMVVRCPVGGGRGYGPTHSQSLQKFFIGVPNLTLYEISPFHDCGALLRHAIATGGPCLFFEDKALYGRPVRRDGVVDEVFRFGLVPAQPPVAHVYADGVDGDCLLIAGGGTAERCVEAMRSLLAREEIGCDLFVYGRLYPFDVEPLWPWLSGARAVVVVEEGTAGGTWGAEVAHRIRSTVGGAAPEVRLVHSLDRVIPAAPHLERLVLVQDDWIHRTVVEALHG